MLDVLIVGQGLAGSTLGYYLSQTSAKFAIIDNRHRFSSSKIAGGIVDPLSGKRLTLSWKAELLIPFAKQFYESLETVFCRRLITRKNVIRFIRDPITEALWPKRRDDPDFHRYIVGSTGIMPGFRLPLEGIETTSSFSILSESLLTAFTDYFSNRHLLISDQFSFSDFREETDHIEWRDIRARRVIFCEGSQIIHNPFFDNIRFRHAKGEVWTIKNTTLPQTHIFCRDHILLPIGDGAFKYGSTYDWDTADWAPSRTGYEKLHASLDEWIPPSTLLVQEAGVRPISRDNHPIVGFHKHRPKIGVLNGFGSKGFMVAPYYARQLCQHLLCSHPIDKDVNLNRFIL